MKTFLGKLGIKEDTLTALDTLVSDRVLVMDGDASCYEAATTVAKLDTALRRENPRGYVPDAKPFGTRSHNARRLIQSGQTPLRRGTAISSQSRS